MNISASRGQLQNFRARWKLVNDAEKKELRSTSIATKARQLDVMMAAARELNWLSALDAEEDEARRTWQNLRERHQRKIHGTIESE